jgi:hypothetical protein
VTVKLAGTKYRLGAEFAIRNANEIGLSGAVVPAVSESAPASVNTAAINAALAASRNVIIPGGAYAVASPVQILVDGTTLSGVGNVLLVATGGDSTDIIQIGDGTNEISRVCIRDITLWATTAKTGGYGVNGRLISDSVLENVRVGYIDGYVAASNQHRLYHGIYFDRYSQCAVLGGEVVAAQDGICARGNSNQSFGAELSFDDGLRVFKAAGAGVRIGGACGGVYFGRVDVSECAAGGVVIDQTLTNAANREAIFSDECTLDTCATAGLVLNQSSALAARFIVRAWISGSTSGGHGILVSAGNEARLIVKAHIYGNTGDGLRVSDTTCYVHVSASEFDLNTGWAINPTVNTARLTVDQYSTLFLGNTAGTINLASITSAPVMSASSAANKGVVLRPDGALEIVAATPYIDFKNLDAEDYDVRLSRSDVGLGVDGGTFRVPVYTVATLPSPNPAGQRALVSDSSVTTLASALAGGGANVVPVYSDGSSWRVG